jgi:hypothetical protein
MSVLSYLQLPEPAYVPKYAALDTSLLNTVDTQIEGQIQQGKKDLSTFDQLADTTSKSLSVLPESYQRQYNEALTQAKAQLDADVEKYGYRNIQGRVGNIARDFQNQVNPLLQTANQVAAAYKRIDDSKAEGVYKQVGRAAINQALESGETYKAPEYIAAFENWRDLRKDINDLASGWQAGTTQLVDMPVESEAGKYVYRAIRESGRPDEFARAAASMLTDAQSRAQIEIMTRARGVEPTEQEMALTVQNLIDPNVAKLSYQRDKDVQRAEIESANYLDAIQLTLGQRGSNELSTVSGIEKMNRGYQSSLLVIENQLNKYISDQSINNPEFNNAQLKWNPQNESYEIVGKNGNIISRYLDAEGKPIPHSVVAQATLQRRFFDQEKRGREKLLNDAVREATSGQYTTFEQFIKNDPELKTRLENLEKQQKGFSQAFDIYTQGYAAPGESIQSGSDSFMSYISNVNMESLSPTVKKINEILASKVGDREITINPVSLPKADTDYLTGIWSAIKKTEGIFDRNGNQLELSQLPEKSRFLGYSRTNNGFELIWSAEPTAQEVKDGIYSDVIRTTPSGNLAEMLVSRSGRDLALATIGQQLTSLSNPQSAIKSTKYEIKTKNGNTVPFFIEFNPRSNNYEMAVPEEFRTGRAGYLQFTDVNQAAAYIFNVQREASKPNANRTKPNN